jgi:hypothetical protein
MLRRSLLVIAAVVFPLGVGVFVSTPASASIPTVTANGSATCTNLSGAIHFNPPLFNTATSTSETTTIKVKLNSLASGCSTTATNLAGGGSLYGIASATLTTSSNACSGLATSLPVSLKIAWHYKNPSTAVTLDKLVPTTVSLSGFDVLTNAASEPGFDLPQDTGGTSNATGSFAGTSSTANAFAGKTISFITTKCGSSTGLTALKLGGAGTASDPSESITG